MSIKLTSRGVPLLISGQVPHLVNEKNNNNGVTLRKPCHCINLGRKNALTERLGKMVAEKKATSGKSSKVLKSLL